ncbi:MAG: TIGR04372 family glycosyltransferase, partial [Selenomonas sp.]|nr:TIGR04372 family glycosyltransferase [Selenomonas sp.]
MDIVNKAMQNQDIEVTKLDDNIDMLWFQDLIYFMEWIFRQRKCLKHDYTLTSHFKYTMRRLLLEIGKITNSSSNVILTEQQEEDIHAASDDVWRDLSWCTTADIDMVRKLLPINWVRQYGRLPYIVNYMQNYDEIALMMYGYLMKFAHKEGDYTGAYATVYQALRQKYQKFIFEVFDCTGISYMNFNVYLYTLEKKNDNALHVFLPLTVDGKPFDTTKIPNKWLWQHLQNEREIVDEYNAGFWQYVVKEHFADVQFSVDYYNLLVQEREMDFQYKPLSKDSIINFTVEESRKAENAMKEMGLADKEYVCVFARDGVYEKEKYKDTERCDFIIDNDRVRNSSIENYRQMIDNLAARDIYTVRMGAVCERPFAADKFIDYASNYRTEMMDYYLLSKAKYFVCTCSGIFSIAMLFGTPLVWVNTVVFSILRDNKPILNPMRDLQIP